MTMNSTTFAQAGLHAAIIRDPLIVSVETRVVEAIAQMSAIRIVCNTKKSSVLQVEEMQVAVRASCVLVVENEHLVGILTERDVVKLTAQYGFLENLTIREVMRSPSVTLYESTLPDLFVVMGLLKKYHVHHIPVLNDQHGVIGLVTNESLRHTTRPVDILRLRTVSEVMTSEVVWAMSDSSMLEVSQRMFDHHVSSIIIVRTDNQEESARIPLGILTERDIVQFQALGLNLEGCLAESVMSSPVFTVSPDDSLWEAQQIMGQNLINRLAVTNRRGDLLGIITHSDLMQVLNPLEIYRQSEVLEEKVVQLESEKMQLLESRNLELERQVAARTIALEAKVKREQLLTSVTMQIRSSLSLQVILDNTVEHVRQLMGCDRVNIWRIEPNRDCFIVAESTNSPISLVGEQIDIDSIGQKSIDIYEKGWVRVVYDAQETEMSDYQRALEMGLRLRAKILVPLLCGDELWGFLNATECEAPRKWQQDEVGLLQTLALHLGIALQQATTHEKLHEHLAECQLVELRLRESEAKNRAILAAIPDIMLRVGADGIYRGYVTDHRDFDVLPQGADRTGLSMTDILPPDIATTNMEYLHRAIDTGELQVYEQQIIVNGWVQDEEVRVVKSGIDEALFMIRDINDRKQSERLIQQLNQELELKVEQRTAELQLRKAELQNLSERLSIALKSAEIGYWEWDIIENTQIWDDRMYELYGITKESDSPFPSEVWINCIHSEDFRYVDNSIQMLISGVGDMKNHDTEFRIIHPDGTIRFIKTYGVLVRDEQGDPQKMIGVNFDVSDRKHSELERLEILQELSYFKLALDQSAIVAITNAKGVITYSNDLLCEISGYSRTELLGNTHRLINSGYHPPSFFEDMWRTIGNGRVWRGEICNRAKNDSLYWMITTIVPFSDESGKPYQYLAIRFDITKRKLAESQLQQINQELARATRLKDEFLANMSHELRTPLNAILGMTEGLQSGYFGETNPEQNEALKIIESSGSHLLELIDDILNLAKIEAENLELDLIPISVEHLCQSSLTFIKQQALQKRINIHVKLQPNLPDLLVDERRIRQVLINLLNNAVKFTPSGGTITLESSQVRSELRSEGAIDYVQISVSDTGIGIAEKDIGKLFQPFVQIDSALNRQYNGTGLGLALVKRIAELHGGHVALTSELGVGSCFTVDLPCLPLILANTCTEKTDPIPVSDQEPPCSIADRKDNQSALILLVEDDQVNILTFSAFLKVKGYCFIVAKDGQTAIDLVKTHHPDLVLMDIQMPGMDGLEAIKQIRLEPKLRKIPIIALTALAMKGDRDRCLAAGANEYITKPVKLQQLETQIQQFLNTNEAIV